ncbi:hypothetical protein PGT21_002615 [Puccinia graminis f. sp. tritici]|uniref:Uncharacterized protein n=2 Tax=Puccinia graminis f. sp. tritici TaxID=56615 RepID=E3JVB6_PUCGT|nr:uncharacterized protein PGTG_01322 [Puccinia graminis f. sp. tritici CRL 75-36-700-3]EFP75991.2 hypothetical protein PGTG_01322 [Puccinia graminis f. sp. tritici CRL 75-36-700-3]KAA1077306.1 hypothetical protein PGT21_002615 [Puccinia graminis f. sp. tritici]
MDKSTKPASSPSGTDQSISRRRDVIAAAFRSFRTKYDCRSLGQPRPTPFEQAIPVDQASWKSNLSCLECSLLPLLRHQVNALSRSICSFNLRKDKGRKLDLISELQSEFDHTVSQIVSYATIICHQPLFSRAHTDDHYLQDLKDFRSQKLVFKISFLTHELSFFSDGCTMLIQESKLSQGAGRRRARKFNARGRVTQFAAIASDSIDRMIKWLRGHELTIIQEDWKIDLSSIDDMLAKLTKLINSRTDSDEDGQSKIKAPSAPIIQLARSAVPIVKLSRMFFRKLSSSGLNETPLQSFTAMSSDQLRTLCRSTELIATELNKILKTFSKAEQTNNAETAQGLSKSAGRVLHLLQSNMLLVTLYVLPLIPTVNNSSSQNHLKTWLITWNNLFLSTAEKCISAANTFQMGS